MFIKIIYIVHYVIVLDDFMIYYIQVSRLDAVFMIDCEEAKAMDKMLRKGRTSNKPEHSMSAVTAKMNYFKGNIHVL